MALHARDLVEFCHTLQTGSERELKKALRDTLMRAALYELLSTMGTLHYSFPKQCFLIMSYCFCMLSEFAKVFERKADVYR